MSNYQIAHSAMQDAMSQFNPQRPKVSTRRARKQFGRLSDEGHSAKEYELNYGTEAEAVSLENLNKALGRGL